MLSNTDSHIITHLYVASISGQSDELDPNQSVQLLGCNWESRTLYMNIVCVHVCVCTLNNLKWCACNQSINQSCTSSHAVQTELRDIIDILTCDMHYYNNTTPQKNGVGMGPQCGHAHALPLILYRKVYIN